MYIIQYTTKVSLACNRQKNYKQISIDHVLQASQLIMLHKTIVINVILLYIFKRRFLLKIINTTETFFNNIPFLDYSQYLLTFFLQSFQL